LRREVGRRTTTALQQHFAAMGWKLWDDGAIRGLLTDLVDAGFENDVALVVAKILLRADPREGDTE
jgi:hypothetical protein